jgi:Tol biopolymer transport system component
MRRTSALVVMFMLAIAWTWTGLALTSANAVGVNGKIALSQAGEDDAVSGFTIDPDGSSLQQIGTTGNTTCGHWSPDGSTLLCNVWSDVGVQPATANPDGSDFTLLNPDLPLDLFCKDWSPDATRLFCHSEGIMHPADEGLYTVRASDAGDLVQLSATPDGYADTMYGYSPDGSRILFSRNDEESNVGTLFAISPDGGDLLQLSPPDLPVVSTNAELEADWSPDGSQVAFAAQWKSSPGRGIALYVVNADGSGVRQITSSGVGAVSAQWSPDGQLIAFTSKLRSRAQVWVVHPDGSGLRAITSGTDGSVSEFPVWSPDATKLLFERTNKRGSALWTVNSDATGLTKLTDISGGGYAWGTAPVG